MHLIILTINNLFYLLVALGQILFERLTETCKLCLDVRTEKPIMA